MYTYIVGTSIVIYKDNIEILFYLWLHIMLLTISHSLNLSLYL